MRSMLAGIALCAGQAALAPQDLDRVVTTHAPAEAATAQVRVDSIAHVVTIRVGPLSLEGMEMPLEGHMGRDHVVFLTWPTDAYLTGYSVAFTDASGAPLPRDELHHAGVANLGRRELLHDAYERMLAVGKETEAVELPPVIGVPMHAGDSLAIYVGLHSPRGESVTNAFVTLRLPFVPKRRHFNPLAVWPMHFELNFSGGATTAYDLPPGRSARSDSFVMPLSGRLLAVGGHVHDYATALRVSECRSGKVLVDLKAHRNADGTIAGLDRFVFGFRDYGLRVEKGACYRVTAIYDNPTGRVLRDGGMASIGGPLMLDDERDWPALDKTHPAVAVDRDSL